jgi:hypothetical protein
MNTKSNNNSGGRGSSSGGGARSDNFSGLINYSWSKFSDPNFVVGVCMALDITQGKRRNRRNGPREK